MKDKLRLPDCRTHDVAFSLSAADKRELVLRIAQGGEDAIDAFIREREAAGDSLIAAKIRRLREELLRRAQELKEKLEGGFAARQQEMETAYAKAYAELDAQRKDMESRLQAYRAEEGAALADSDVLNLVLNAPPPTRRPWGARIRRFLLVLLGWLLAPLRWILKLLGLGKPARKPKRITFAVPVAGRLGVDVESRAGEAYLANPQFRKQVKQRLRAAPARERLRRAWERLLGREDYESLAAKAMQQMLEEEAERKRAGIREKENEVATALSRVMETEAQKRAEREKALERLMQERAQEAARMERELAEAPQRELKEEILGELRATGLLREKGGKLLPTLAFMDAFASSVYAEETRRLAGGSQGAAGAYAEGVGNFLRGPLRTRLEISQADLVASLTRARQRHPHVRHLTEDDLLVYREEREALQHVVIVFDRSGSMEENGRLDAAKRAVLALAHAVKQENPRNRVDVVQMDTSVKRVDLLGVWEAEPRGFTNTGGALRLARDILRESKTERGLVYLITDGLPEAYTVDGEDVAGRPEKAQAFALEQARALKRLGSLGGFVCLLLEPEDEMYVRAADALAKELDGRVLKVDPKNLAQTLVREFERPEKLQATPRL